MVKINAQEKMIIAFRHQAVFNTRFRQHERKLTYLAERKSHKTATGAGNP